MTGGLDVRRPVAVVACVVLAIGHVALMHAVVSSPVGTQYFFDDGEDRWTGVAPALIGVALAWGEAAVIGVQRTALVWAATVVGCLATVQTIGAGLVCGVAVAVLLAGVALVRQAVPAVHRWPVALLGAALGVWCLMAWVLLDREPITDTSVAAAGPTVVLGGPWPWVEQDLHSSSWSMRGSWMLEPSGDVPTRIHGIALAASASLLVLGCAATLEVSAACGDLSTSSFLATSASDRRCARGRRSSRTR